MINQVFDKANPTARKLAGTVLPTAAPPQSPSPAPSQGKGQDDPGIINRMRDYRDWWNIPARRPKRV